MNEAELMTRFIEENTDIALKYIIWKEHILQLEDTNYKNDGVDFTSK